MNVFESVKMSVSMTEAAERYGVEVSHNGKALCPFHNDHHPSLFVSDDHYHCYACGEHGDVIDFVAKLFGLSLYDAAKKLAYDFGIQTDKPPTKAMQEKWNKKTEAQRLRETEKLCFSALMAYFHLLEDWQVAYAPKTPEDEVDSRFSEACHWLPQVEYWVDLLLSGDSYEREDVVNLLMTDDKLEKLQNHLKEAEEKDEYDETQKHNDREPACLV